MRPIEISNKERYRFHLAYQKDVSSKIDVIRVKILNVYSNAHKYTLAGGVDGFIKKGDVYHGVSLVRLTLANLAGHAQYGLYTQHGENQGQMEDKDDR